VTKTLNPDLSRYRYRLIALSIGAALALFAALGLTGGRALAATMSPCSATTHAPCLFGPAADGGFEIDGNRTVDSSNGIDWSTASSVMSVTHFTDLYSSQQDDGFVQGSFRNNQSTWTCDQHKSAPKVDIITGDIALRTVSGQQYMYVDFSRVSGSGDGFFEFNFSQATHNLTTNQGCNSLPKRQTGDLSFEFGFTGGGATRTIALEKWTCDYTQVNPALQCSFVDLPIGSEGVGWESGYDDTGNKATYGEAAVNLTQVEGLGAISCTQFSKVWMDSHASEGETDEMKDLVAPITFNACGNPTVVTTASAAVTLGSNISDTAALSGGVSPTGTMTFKAYGPGATCGGTPTFTSTVPVNGNGNYGSGNFLPLATGTYRFVAAYSGDANNSPASDSCEAANETVVVSPVAPVVVPSPPGGGTEGTSNGTNNGSNNGSNPGGGVAPASGVAPAAVGLPLTGAGPQGSSPLSGAAFAILLVFALIGLLAVIGCVLDARRNGAAAEA
jgi:hypothetical protein